MAQRGQTRFPIRWAAVIVSLVCLVPVSASGPDRSGDDDAVVAPGMELAAALNLRDKFLSEVHLVDDAVLVGEVRRVGRLVAAKSDRPDLPYAFYVLESGDGAADYQAISLPGGTIGLTRALAEMLVESEDELAFALAHEVAHVALRHHLSEAHLLDNGSKAWTRYAQSVQHHQEFVADRYGALYLVRAGLRFSAASDALSRIAAIAGNVKLDLKRHPSYKQRLEALEAFIPELLRSEAAFNRGGEFLRDGKIDDALRALTVFVQQFPHSVAGRVNLGTACLVQLARQSGSPGGLEEPLPYLQTSGIVIRGVYDGDLPNPLLGMSSADFAAQAAGVYAANGISVLMLDPQGACLSGRRKLNSRRVGETVVQTREIYRASIGSSRATQ